jgi:Fe-S oxidoreductase
MAQHGVTGIPYGHFGDGCLHVRIDFPLDAAGGASVFRAFLLDAARLVVAHGGSMSGEHGDGRARSELLAQMYSPAALNLFADVKDAFDPDGVLNPGIIVRPAAMDADLRIPQARSIRTGLALAYAHDDGDFTAAVHRCTGVGKCRADTTATGGVMCPSFLATRDEKDSTRGRARVLQELANGGLVTGGWRSPEVHEALDLCLSCKGCASDCPTGVDMAAYKAEVLHQAYRRRLRPASHYALGWLPRWARLASAMPGLVNAALRVRPLATVAKRLGGIDARRPLPEFASRTFRSWFAGRTAPATGPRGPVLLWVDTFTDHFSPQVGVAAVRVLEAAGFEVRIPEAGLCCALTWISTGQLDAAKRILARSVDALAPAVADGIPVVGLEPSCTAVFRGDALELLGPRTPAGSPVEDVSGGVLTLAELLARHAPGFSVPLDGVRAVAQPHCHQHAVLGWEADATLLKSAGARISAVGGCCGLAGNFGVERGHYDVSVAVAETALLPAVRAAGPDDVVLADGFSCRTQLEQLAGRRGLHLAELLADRLA